MLFTYEDIKKVLAKSPLTLNVVARWKFTGNWKIVGYLDGKHKINPNYIEHSGG